MDYFKIPDRLQGTVYVSIYCNPTSPLYGRLSLTLYDPVGLPSAYDDLGISDIMLLGKFEVDEPLTDKDTAIETQIQALLSAKTHMLGRVKKNTTEIDSKLDTLTKQLNKEHSR